MRLPSSIAARLILWLSVIALVTFAVCAFLLHAALKSILLDDELSDLQGKVAVVKRFIAETTRSDEMPVLKRHLDATSVGGRFRWNVWIVGADERPLYGGEGPPSYTTRQDGRVLIHRPDGLELRGTRFMVDSEGPISGASVFIGMDPRPRTLMLDRFDYLSLLICGLGVAAIVAMSVVATRRGLSPIVRLSKLAEQIGPESLSLRLPLPDRHSELLPLTQQLNAALQRVEDSWHRLEAFSADVAHELRTPLAVLISGAEVALSRPRSMEEMHEAMAMLLEDLRGISEMVNDMLFLARADSGTAPELLATVSLRDEALTVADYMETLLTQKSQSLQVLGDCEVKASDSLVRRALVNLVMNGIRHAPDGGQLVVRISSENDEARIAVSNPGEPIAATDQRRMFDRFWRGDASRTKAGDRSGLGLAIVKAVATMHRGRTFVSCTGGETTVGFSIRA